MDRMSKLTTEVLQTVYYELGIHHRTTTNLKKLKTHIEAITEELLKACAANGVLRDAVHTQMLRLYTIAAHSPQANYLAIKPIYQALEALSDDGVEREHRWVESSPWTRLRDLVRSGAFCANCKIAADKVEVK